jgi:Na+/H+ antiporter NhaD/arsenite permease-like protein
MLPHLPAAMEKFIARWNETGRGRFQLWLLATGLLAICMVLVLAPERHELDPDEAPRLAAGSAVLVGSVHDRQNLPVEAASVRLRKPGAAAPLAAALTQHDGRYVLLAPQPVPEGLYVEIRRDHFEDLRLQLDQPVHAELEAGRPAVLSPATMLRRRGLAFWVTTSIFLVVLGLMASGLQHNTLAALVGVAGLFSFSYIGRAVRDELYIFDFRGALGYVDWNVIFLIMGMMIVIAVVEETGIFQWLAFAAFRASKGDRKVLLIVLMIITGIASALLDNVTTMLLMAPISVQIALALRMNPLTLLIPEVMASNVFGISTLIGTPTNILIGSYARISFTGFLTNLTPGVLVALAGLTAYCLWVFRDDLSAEGEAAAELMQLLEERGRIRQPEELRKAAWVGAAMLALFLLGERIHLLPSVTALVGATALLSWIKPDMEKMIEAIDWTTLVFFIAIFIVVGAVREVGLISFIAEQIGVLVGGNLMLAMLAVLWIGALFSTVIANIPFTAAMLPVVGHLSLTIPGAETKALFFCLAVGSAMGGNGSLIGASANMVTAGIAERAGYPITYLYFLKKGVPALFLTVSLASLWLLLRFLVLV